MKKRLPALLLALVLILCPCIAALADFGDYSSDYDYDYDYGWDDDDDWDYGWDDDDDWDWDWDDDDDWDWDWDWDDDDDDDWGWSSSGSSYNYGSNTTYVSSEYDEDFTTVLGAIIFFGIIALIIWSVIKKRKRKEHLKERMISRYGKGPLTSAAQKFEAPSLRPMSEYYDLDPNFSVDTLKERCANLYVQMQNCWTAKDLQPLEPYFTDAFLSQMNRQLDAMRRAGRTNYVDNICVLGVEFMGFNQQGGSDHLFARVTARITDYTLDDANGNLVNGDRSRQKHMTYEWNLTRATGTLTSEGTGTETVNCPNCGAPLDVNASARCPYCGSVLQRSASDWALCGIRGLRQQSN